KIRSMLGIDIKKISLSFSSKPLEDHQTLEFYNIKQNDTIHVSRKNNVGNVEPAEHDFENDEPTKHDEKIDDIQIPMKPIRIFAYYHRIYSLNVTTNDTVLEKTIELESYKIKDNDTINVSRKNNVGNVEPAEHNDVDKIDDKQTIKPADVNNDKKIENNEKTIQIPTKSIRIFAYYHKNYALNITLSFSGKPLEDHRTLEYYKIKQNDTIHVSRRIIGGAFDYFVLTNDYLDPRYDNDFSNQRDGPTLKRGNEPYKPPYGWNRIAINIKRYGDNKWLGTDNNSWPVSFHGISKDAAENGLIFQKENALRMEKESIQHLMVDPSDLHKANNDLYWITADDKNIRPY
ncbi:21728_t:CDS:2, partial [Gigaspora rosea]